MKTTLKKIARLSFALIIPAAFIVGCQEDLTEPQHAMPDKDRVVNPNKK